MPLFLSHKIKQDIVMMTMAHKALEIKIFSSIFKKIVGWWIVKESLLVRPPVVYERSHQTTGGPMTTNKL